MSPTSNKGINGNFEVIPRSEAGVHSELQELQGTVRHVVTQLERLNAEDSLLNKHGVEKEFLTQLEQLAGEDLSTKDEETLDVWQKTAEAAIEKLFPLLQEAHEIHQSRQDRIKKLRERHNLSEVERLEDLVLELLPAGTSVEKRLEIRGKRDILKKGKRVSKEYRAKGDSTNAPSFCEYESESGEKMGGVAKESLREGAKGFMPYEDDGQLHLSEKIIDPETGAVTWKKHDYGGVNKDSKIGAEAVRRTNNLITFLTSQMLEDGVKELLAKEAGTSPESISYDNSVGNARVSVLPGESTVREVMQSWVDMMVDFEVVPITVMRPEEDGTDVASVQENVTYHESVADPDSPLIAHQLSDTEADWFFETPPSYWGEILKTSDPDEPMEEDPEWAKKDPARSLIRAGILAFLMGDLDGIERNIMFHPVTGRIWKIDNGLSSGVVTGKELPGIKNTDTGRPYREVVKSIPLELVIRHNLSLDDEAHASVKQLSAELRDTKSRHYACMQGMFRLTFGKYGDIIADNRFQEFLGRLEMIAEYGKPVGLVYGDDYSRPMEEGFAEAQAEAQKEKQAA